VNSEVNNATKKRRLLPTKFSLAAAALLTVIFTLSASASLAVGDIITALLSFVSASAVLSFFLVFVRRPLAFLVPVLSAAVGMVFGVHLLVCAAVACGITVFAVIYALCHLKIVSSFRQFAITAACYILCGGALLCFIFYQAYGSVSAGVVAFGEKMASMAPVLAEAAVKNGLEYDTALSAFSSLLADTHVYLPAIVGTIGIMCAWLMRGVFSLYTVISGIPSLFSGRMTPAPKGLAAVFLILSFFWLFFAFLPEGTLYALSNIRSLISAVFLGEGVRVFFSPRKGRRRSHPAFIMGLLVLVFFLPVIVPVILPYYGAIGVLFDKKDVKINSSNNSEGK